MSRPVHGRLAGKRILVVEDEYFIADQLKKVLLSQGAIVVGPIADLDAGVATARTEKLDGALLDINLDGEFSFPIADCLSKRDIPWLFVTGFDGWAIPEPYCRSARLIKPFTTSRVLDAIVDAMSAEPVD